MAGSRFPSLRGARGGSDFPYRKAHARVSFVPSLQLPCRLPGFSSGRGKCRRQQNLKSCGGCVSLQATTEPHYPVNYVDQLLINTGGSDDDGAGRGGMAGN